MRAIQRYVSPDAQIAIAVTQGEAGEVAVGFEGGEWHTHPDLLAVWLGVPEEKAVARFVELVCTDRLPVILSTDGGQTIDPWVSDNLTETLRLFGKENCVLRHWSGNVEGEGVL